MRVDWGIEKKWAVAAGVSSCARLSLACLADESSAMLIARSTCSGPCVRRSDPSVRSPGEQRGEPQRKRIRFGLVTSKSTTANLPRMAKPDTRSEATREHGRGGPGWLGAARLERQAEEPGRSVWVGKTQLLRRMHKASGACSEVGRVHSSWEAGNDRGAKGRDCRSAFIKTRSSA